MCDTKALETDKRKNMCRDKAMPKNYESQGRKGKKLERNDISVVVILPIFIKKNWKHVNLCCRYIVNYKLYDKIQSVELDLIRNIIAYRLRATMNYGRWQFYPRPH